MTRRNRRKRLHAFGTRDSRALALMRVRCLPALSILGLSAVITSCGGQTGALKPVSRCVVDKVCLVEGKLVAGDGTGRIEGTEPDDETNTNCVAVALPQDFGGDFDAVPV